MRRILPTLVLTVLMATVFTAPVSAVVANPNHDFRQRPCPVLGAAIMGSNPALANRYTEALPDGSLNASPTKGLANGRDTALGTLPNPGSRSAVIGCSVEGRPIVAYVVGNGPVLIAVIGGIHQGQEANTTLLVEMLSQFYEANRAEIPDGIGLIFIPNMNPDGAAAGTRENSRGVDLNRNWGVNWRMDTFTAFGVVKGGGGSAPYSEPETRTIRKFLDETHIAAVIFYHSRAGRVVPGNGEARAKEFAMAVANATGYDFTPTWTAYPVSGAAVDYCENAGCVAVDIELMTHEEPEFKRNLRGMDAALAYVLHAALNRGSPPRD